MKNNLNKIKRLTQNSDISERVGAAMFMRAKDIDLETASDADKGFVQWIMNNPLVPDQTMLALVATSDDVLANSTLPDPASNANASKQASNGGSSVFPNQASDNAVVVDGVDDEAIEQAVADNWSKVAEKYTSSVPTPFVPGVNPVAYIEPVEITSGKDHNPFLDKGVVEPKRRPDGQII